MIVKMSNFLERLWIGLIALIACFIAIYFSHQPSFTVVFAILVSCIAILGLNEMFHLARLKGCQPLILISNGFLVALISSLFLERPLLPYVVMFLYFSALFFYHLIKGEHPFLNISSTFFCFIYVAIPLTCLVYINYLTNQDGRVWLAFLLTVVKSTDIGAYLFGKRLGKRRLAPYTSPQKTWEGAFGGQLFAIASSVLFLTFIPFFPQISGIILAFILGIFAQFGDLAESLLKRDAKVKDSNKLPGFGGILDMLDSLIFTLPLLYLLLHSGWL